MIRRQHWSPYIRALMCSRFLLLCIIALLAGCSKSAKPSPRIKSTQPHTQVFLVSNGWHTSVGVMAKDAPKAMQTLDPQARYFVVGWGGKELYMLADVKPWEWVTTLVLPTMSALHVIPVRSSLLNAFPNSEIIEFDVTARDARRLTQRLARSMKRGKDGGPMVVGPGKLPESRFIAGTEIYYLPKTCNLWAAASLDLAGVPIRVFAAVAADNLIWQGRKHGRVLNTWRRPLDPL